jgi:hypothetical protein
MKNILIAITVVFFSAVAILITIVPRTQFPESIPIESMVHWNGSTSQLTWLNPESYGSTSDGPSPVQRLGAAIEDARLYPYQLDHSLPPDGLELLDGWRVLPNRIKDFKDCLQYEIRLQNTNGKEELFTVESKREENYFSRNFLRCIGGRATTYYVVVVNAKYLAFMTSEPGWVFFDRINGKFLNTIATELRNCGFGSNLLRTTSGQMLIEYVHAKHCSVKSGLHIFGDPAPVLADDTLKVLSLNRSNHCRIEKLHGRQCTRSDRNFGSQGTDDLK